MWKTYWIGYAIVLGLVCFGGFFMWRTGFLGFIANAIVWLLEHWYLFLGIAVIVVILLEASGVHVLG